MAGRGTAHLRTDDDILLQVEDLVVEFPVGRGRVVNAVSGISFDIAKGETLGLVGESGCGKSTTGRAILQLPKPTGGDVGLRGEDLTRLDDESMRRKRTDVQMIFQDPISSLNPRRTIGEIVAEPLKVWGPHDPDEQWKIVSDMLEHVGIDPDVARYKRPHEFSGGQCQRISIARALVVQPQVVICDEPVSALDVSVQAQVLNLLEDLKAKHGISLIFIAHDLAVVRHICKRVAVMYLGLIVEQAPPDTLFYNPQHPYTKALIAAQPEPDMSRPIDLQLVAKGAGAPTSWPEMFRFDGPDAPALRELEPGHMVRCHA